MDLDAEFLQDSNDLGRLWIFVQQTDKIIESVKGLRFWDQKKKLTSMILTVQSMHLHVIQLFLHYRPSCWKKNPL